MHMAYDGKKAVKLMACGGFQIQEIPLEAPFPRMFDEVWGLLEKGVRAYVLNDYDAIRCFASRTD